MIAHVFYNPGAGCKSKLYIFEPDAATSAPAPPVPTPISATIIVFQEYRVRTSPYIWQPLLPTNDNAPSAPAFDFPWRAQFINTPKPPVTIGAYLWQNSEHDASTAVQADGAPSTLLPRMQQPTFPAARLPLYQNPDETGFNATAVTDTGLSWTPRPLPQPKPVTRYYYGQIHSAADQPVQQPPFQAWRRPVTYEPQPIVVRFNGIVGGDVPTPPTPFADTPATWFPRPLQQPKVPPSWRYVWNTPTDNVDEPGTQFQVIWNYQTNYERRARQIQPLLHAGDVTGVSVAEQSTYPGWTGRPMRIEQVPKIARQLYQQQPPEDFNQTAEQSTFPSFVGRKMWPFMAPRGAYAFYWSGQGKDVPPPKPTPTFHQPPTKMYMRRQELLGVRLAMTSGPGWTPV